MQTILYGEGGEIKRRVLPVNGNPTMVVLRRVNEEWIMRDLHMIEKTLQERGIGVLWAAQDHEPWIGDAWVYHNGTYIPSSHFGGMGESGFVVNGCDFAVIGTQANESGSYVEAGFEPQWSWWRRNPDAYVDLEARVYEGTKLFHIAGFTSTGTSLWDNPYTWRHIDLVMGSVPQRKLVTVWDTYYRLHDRIFDEMAEFGITVVPVDCDFSGFSNNYRSLHDESGDFVLIDKRAVKVQKALLDNGIEVVPTIENLKYLTSHDGSIHCATNVVHNETVLKVISETAYRGKLT